MRLDELEWEPIGVGPTRYARFGEHSIWEFGDGILFSIREAWRDHPDDRGRAWDDLDPVTAQAIVYELLKETP